MRTTSLLALFCCLVGGLVGARAQQAQENPVYKTGNGVSAPVLVKQVNPQYTADAMRARVEGVVTLEGVVQPDGVIGEVRVTKPLEPGLDQEAIKAIKQWRFTPGRKDGKPVAVRVSFEMAFTLRDKAARPQFPIAPSAPAAPVAPGDAGATATKVAPEVYKPGAGVSAPVVVTQVKPQYTAEARRARIEGIVVLDCVVGATGSVDDVKVTRSLDEGLDQQAIKAVKQWRFEPGTKGGKPVPVLVSLEMTFTLR